MQISDVLIHINNNINKTERLKLVEKLRGLNGVIAPRFNEPQQHLLFVAYNSDAINATSLLDKVKAKGLQAQLVGM